MSEKMTVSVVRLVGGNGQVEYTICYQAPDEEARMKIEGLKTIPDHELNDDKIRLYESEMGLKRQDRLDERTGKIIPAYQELVMYAYIYEYYNDGQPNLMFNLAHGYMIGVTDKLQAFRIDEKGKRIDLEESQSRFFEAYLNFYRNEKEALSRQNLTSFSIAELQHERDATNKIEP